MLIRWQLTPPTKKPNLSSHDDDVDGAAVRSHGVKEHELDNEKEVDDEYGDVDEYDIGANDHEWNLEDDEYGFGYNDGDDEY